MKQCTGMGIYIMMRTYHGLLGVACSLTVLVVSLTVTFVCLFS
jgi:hypothetical protein